MYNVERSANIDLYDLEKDLEFQALCDFWDGQDQPFYAGLSVAWAYQKQRWISLSNQLPSNALMDKEDVLICLETGTVGVGSFILEGEKIQRMTFNGTGKHIDHWKYKPTHWMPLIAAPKEQSID